VTSLLAIVALSACSTVKAPVNSSTVQVENTHRAGVCVENMDIKGLRDRLRALTSGGVAADSYAAAKAQCWLDSAESQFAENDRTGYVAGAMEESATLIRAMEADKSVATMPGGTKHSARDHVREDLWQALGVMKAEPGFKCAAALVACAEVRLVRAGHANDQTGWRQANPHIRLAEKLLSDARLEALKCEKPVAVVVAPPVPQAPVAAPTPIVESISLKADALFKFNQSDKASLLPAGKSKLDWVIQRLKEYQRVDGIDVRGFTDRLGSDRYNLQLSRARAETVRDYLIAGGISASVVSATGMGKSNTAATLCPANMSRSKLVDCLQPDRRVELTIRGMATKVEKPG
jgi:outer membrane protein OmpA-like peptidoglycan-associated protein